MENRILRTGYHRTLSFVMSGLLVGATTGCGGDATEGMGYAGMWEARPNSAPSSEDDEMLPPEEGGSAVPAMEAPAGAVDEGTPGSVALQPTEVPDDSAGTASPPAETQPPAEMPPAPVEPPVVLAPLQKFVGNITTGNAMDTGGLTFSQHWDQVTPENAGKWGSVQRTAASARNWATLDAIYDYTQQQGVIFKQHTFVWGSQQPTGELTQADVQSWMQEFCTRYPNTRLIDVVNEPPPHTEPSYAEAIGGGTDGDWQWIVNSFTWAREYCPNAVLILNDYNNIEVGNQNQHFIDIVRIIQERGAPIDAVGAQAHGLSGANSTGNMINLLTRLHDGTGLPVYITEYDIDQNDDAAQLNRFQEHFAFFLDTEWIRGVTVWGWIFGRTWVPSSGLIRNNAARPAMVWLMEELGRPVPQ